ncbi:hypothetical protein D3C85_1499730 [compost metagenome]
MVHGHHRIEGAGIALHLEEDGVGRVRPVGIDALLPGGSHRRADDIQLLAAEAAVVAVVRVEAADADARFLQPAALECGIDQADRLHYPLLAEQARHIGQGHVGGHPRSPEIVEHVEFAERSMEIQQLGEPVQLVAVGHAGHVQ